MPHDFTDAELSAFLDEDLPPDRLSALEQALRTDEQLAERLTGIVGQRNAGLHSLGGIWRKHRLSCPTREQLGSLLLGALDSAEEKYYRFHLETVGCRLCNANLADLRNEVAARDDQGIETRRRRYFQSSAGYLKQGEK